MPAEKTVDEVALVANAVGPNKDTMEGQGLGAAQNAMAATHAAGMAVHPWTLRQDNVPAMFTAFPDPASSEAAVPEALRKADERQAAEGS